jgi:RimJ/RimL family protein N-acetyltransferase
VSVRLETERLILREPEERDAPALLLYHQFNEERFARWEPEHSDDLAHHVRWVQWRRGESVIGRGFSLLRSTAPRPTRWSRS